MADEKLNLPMFRKYNRGLDFTTQLVFPLIRRRYYKKVSRKKKSNLLKMLLKVYI